MNIIKKDKKYKYGDLTYSLNNNKKLVNILKNKIFKGYTEIKNSKIFDSKKPKFIRFTDYETNMLEPFEDNYNLYYKRTFLSKIYKNKKINPLTIINFSSSSKEIIPKLNINITKNSNEDFFVTKIPKKKFNRIFSDKKRENFNKIFPELNEAKIYSNVPFLYFERTIQRPITSKDKIILSEGKEYSQYDGLTESEFLYKISHKNLTVNTSINSLSKNKGLKKGFINRQIKRDNDKINNQNEIKSLKDIGIQVTNYSKSEKKNLSNYNMKESLNISITYNDKSNSNEKKDLILNTSFKNNLKTINSGTNNRQFIIGGNKKILKLNDIKMINTRLYTNQPIIDYQNYQKNKFNIIKKITEGN